MCEKSSSAFIPMDSAASIAVKKFQYVIFQSNEHTARISEIARSREDFNSYEIASLRALNEVDRLRLIKDRQNIHYHIECVEQWNLKNIRVYADRANLLGCLLSAAKIQLVHLLGDELVDCGVCSKNCTEPACYDHIINCVKNLDADLLHNIYVMNIFQYKIYEENTDLTRKTFVEDWLVKCSTIKLLRQTLVRYCGEHNIRIENRVDESLMCSLCNDISNIKYVSDNTDEEEEK